MIWLKRTTIAVMFIGLAPTPAAAQFWDLVKWFNDMSGPKMAGVVVEVPLWCRYSDAQGDRMNVPLACAPVTLVEGKRWRRNLTVGFRAGRLTNIHKLGSEATVREISMLLVAPVALRWTPRPYLDLTTSFEMVRFQGPTVDEFWLPTTDVGVVARPFGGWIEPGNPGFRLGQFVGLSVRYKQFYETFGGERFGAPGTFISKHEGIWQYAVVLDGSVFFSRW